MLSISEAYASGEGGARRHKWLAHGQIIRSFGKGYGYWSSVSDLVGCYWRRATSEFPGPVHLELAEGPGLESEEGTETEIADDPSEVMAQVQQAQLPAVIVGSMALRAQWREHLRQLEVPVFTTVAAKGVISEFSRYAAGVYTGDGKPLTPEKRLLPAADLVVAIGIRSGEVLNTDFPNAKSIRLDTPAVRTRGVFPPQGMDGVRYLSDHGFAELLYALQRKSWGADECVGALAAMEQALRRWVWSPVQAYGLVAEALPDAVHVLDTGYFTVLGEHMLRVKTEQNVLGTPNGRYMGLGIGYTLGNAVASSDRPVVLWIGDGGIREFFSELRLAVQHKLKLLVMVMCDGYFGSVRGRAREKGWCTEPLRMQSHDLLRVAGAMGMETLTVKSEELLAGGLAAWSASAQPMLIRCDFDPEEYANVAKLLR